MAGHHNEDQSLYDFLVDEPEVRLAPVSFVYRKMKDHEWRGEAQLASADGG